MEKKQGEFTKFVSQNRTLVISLFISASIFVVQLYLAYIITPIEASIREVKAQSTYVQEEIDNHLQDTKDQLLVPAKLDEVNHRLSRIEKKLGIEF